jgi:hypothetical protein
MSTNCCHGFIDGGVDEIACGESRRIDDRQGGRRVYVEDSGDE